MDEAVTKSDKPSRLIPVGRLFFQISYENSTLAVDF